MKGARFTKAVSKGPGKLRHEAGNGQRQEWQSDG